MSNGAGEIPDEQVPAGPVALKPVGADLAHGHSARCRCWAFGATGLPVLSHANVQINRVQTYLATLVYELFLLGYVWLLGLMRYKVPLREIVGGRWQRPLDFFRDVGIAVLFWLSWCGMLVVARSNWDSAEWMQRNPCCRRRLIELAVFVLLACLRGILRRNCVSGIFAAAIYGLDGKRGRGSRLTIDSFWRGAPLSGIKGVLVITVYGAMFGILAAM